MLTNEVRRVGCGPAAVTTSRSGGCAAAFSSSSSSSSSVPSSTAAEANDEPDDIISLAEQDDPPLLDPAASEARAELLAMLADPSLGATLSAEARQGGGPLSEVASAHLAVLRRKGVCARIVRAFDGFHLRAPPKRARTGRVAAEAAAAETASQNRALGANVVVTSALARALARASDASTFGDGYDDDDDMWEDDDNDDSNDPRRKAGYEARAPELSESSGDEGME
uniref:Uncharacterized protein n=1 Tax=Sexangularia sp. CB-2014 TaxID=1486929 RepID=A0A7S1YF93_9EUKA|mmetsp:Transcript_175/g.528  ORF Transcript_175/g.528 Transcript_175/m.528 type:complete len:226 (+) Transcript_175:636-1313(+)